MLTKNAVIYELENALKLATEYIQQQDEEIKALKEMNSIREYARSNNIKVSEAGLVGISDSALLLGVSTSTVRAMINAREIPCVKTRGRVQMRLKAGFSQSKLAKLVGVDRTSVSKWDLGLSTPKLKTLLKLTKIFQCSFNELLNSFNYKIK